MYEDQVESPEEELKRADHLIYVSLKYTRTVDIMRNAIKRMINAYELVMSDFLEQLRKAKKISEVPTNPKDRGIMVKEILGNSGKKYLILYNTLKKIDKAEYTATEEFRKNVTLKTKTTKPILVKVENLYNYLEITKEFINFMRNNMKH